MSDLLIRDIPSIKAIFDNTKQLKIFKDAFPMIRPILKILGADVTNLDTAVAGIGQLDWGEVLALIPDRFNDHFTSRGWIMFDAMSLKTAILAVEKADAGEIDRAESDLVAYYDDETVRRNLKSMNAVNAFVPRMRLARKALIDYEEGRYHACIPVVLALLDGLVNELHEKHRGFFSNDVKLTAWDSVAAHSRGLSKLSDIFRKGIKKTTTDEITIPYRNGILHGMDLAYDNKIVAAKTWAALFATGDWAVKVEKNELTAPPEEPETSWSDLIIRLHDNSEVQKTLAAWAPRKIAVGCEAPSSGNPNEYEDGTPEKLVVEYLTYWTNRNYGDMARCLRDSLRQSFGDVVRAIRVTFEAKSLISFELTKITDDSSASTDIHTKLIYEESGHQVQKPMKFRLVNLDTEMHSVIRGEPNGKWYFADGHVV